MKFIALAFVCLIAVVSAADVKPGDFRQEFDQLLAEWARDKISEGEHFLLRLTEEMAAFRKSPTKVEQDKLLAEMDSSLAHVNAINHYLSEEVKRTDLNLLEKFTFDSLRASSDVLVKDLMAAEKEIKAVPVHA